MNSHYLDGCWRAVAIDDIAIESPNKPLLELNSSQLAVYGNDSCNTYRGTLLQLDQRSIHFGPLASTRKMCENMSTADSYNRALQRTRSYQVDADLLRFYDEQKQEIVRFHRDS